MRVSYVVKCERVWSAVLPISVIEESKAQSFKEKGSFTNMPQAVGINIVCPSPSPLHPNDNIQ